MKKNIHYPAAILLAAFALLTLFLSSSILFNWFSIREKEGNYVGFVVAANFICSLLYLISSVGLVTKKRWSFYFLSISFIILFITFVSFLIYINSGGVYETKTISALIFRQVLTLLFTIFSYLFIVKKQK